MLLQMSVKPSEIGAHLNSWILFQIYPQVRIGRREDGGCLETSIRNICSSKRRGFLGSGPVSCSCKIHVGRISELQKRISCLFVFFYSYGHWCATHIVFNI